MYTLFEQSCSHDPPIEFTYKGEEKLILSNSQNKYIFDLIGIFFRLKIKLKLVQVLKVLFQFC